MTTPTHSPLLRCCACVGQRGHRPCQSPDGLGWTGLLLLLGAGLASWGLVVGLVLGARALLLLWGGGS